MDGSFQLEDVDDVVARRHSNRSEPMRRAVKHNKRTERNGIERETKSIGSGTEEGKKDDNTQNVYVCAVYPHNGTNNNKNR